MVQDRETVLRELSIKIQELIESQNRSNLLESMAFFALLKLLKVIEYTEQAVTATLQDYIGAMFEIFEQMFDSKTGERVPNTVSKVNKIISLAFIPKPKHTLTPSFALAF